MHQRGISTSTANEAAESRSPVLSLHAANKCVYFGAVSRTNREQERKKEIDSVLVSLVAGLDRLFQDVHEKSQRRFTRRNNNHG